MEKQFENTKHPIKVAGKDVTGHTAKHIDADNPPRREPKGTAPASSGSKNNSPAKPAAS
jgi:hypothetical protein